MERVRSATDLVALVSEHVALRRVGTRWVGLCPFHAEKTPSFSVNAEMGLYYCFGCQVRGDAISFLRETEHVDFVGAVESLAARAGIALRYDEGTGASAERKRAGELGEVMQKAVAWYHERLLKAPDAAQARAYLRSRGYDGDAVRHYSLGWAPQAWDSLVRGLGASRELLVGAGLAFLNSAGHLSDSFRGRVLFPVFDVAGRPVGLGGRILPGGEGPKYKNTSNTRLYDKSRVLYGLNWAKSAVVERGQVVVCEGYTDVIGLHRAGVQEAVATCGTALAEGHVKLLTGFARRVVLAYDADSAGQGAAEHFYDWERKFEADIRVVALPAGADPADMALSNPDGLRSAVGEAKPYLGFRVERILSSADLRSPEGRARAAEACMALVAAHPDPLVRDQYVMQVADRCRLSPDQLRGLRTQSPRPRGEGRRDSGQVRPARIPPPELEALRIAVHQPQAVVGRLHALLFSSELAREAFSQLASAMTLHQAIEGASSDVAQLLGRLGVEESQEDASDVLRRLLEQAARRALAELQREAQATAPSAARAANSPSDEQDLPSETRHAQLVREAATLRLALEELLSIDQGPGSDVKLVDAEGRLLTLLLGRPITASS